MKKFWEKNNFHQISTQIWRVVREPILPAFAQPYSRITLTPPLACTYVATESPGIATSAANNSPNNPNANPPTAAIPHPTPKKKGIRRTKDQILLLNN